MSAKAEFMKQWMRELAVEHATESSRKARAGAPASAGQAAEAAPASVGPQMESARDIQGVPHLGAFADMDFFYLLSRISWRPREVGDLFKPVDVPPGFVTDLASVPGVFWSIASPQGRHGVAAIVHDWLYWHQDRTRAEADLVFARIMRDLNVSTFKRWVFYYAVRLRAGQWWEQYARDKANGRLEPRILKRFPDRADVTWEEWRKDKSVFV